MFVSLIRVSFCCASRNVLFHNIVGRNDLIFTWIQQKCLVPRLATEGWFNTTVGDYYYYFFFFLEVTLNFDVDLLIVFERYFCWIVGNLKACTLEASALSFQINLPIYKKKNYISDVSLVKSGPEQWWYTLYNCTCSPQVHQWPWCRSGT